MPRVREKQTFGLIVGTRGFFNPALAAEGREQLVARLKKLGYGSVILPKDATPTGAVETLEDAKKCGRLFDEKKGEIDGIIVSLPNFGDELGIVNTLRMAGLDVPVLIQACDDDPDKVDIKRRRDAFCGKLSVTNNLYQYGIPFTDTSLHTYPIESEHLDRDLAYFAGVCRVVRGLKSARVGAIGARPAAFQTMRASEKLLQFSGITVVPVDLSDIFAAANAIADDAKEVKAKDAEIRGYGNVPSHIKSDAMTRNAKFQLAVEHWIEENEIDAFSVQCWTSMQLNYGCASCTAMSMMGEKLCPGACEVDIAGAIAMYALALAAWRPAALLDWNNNYGDDRDLCVCTHCSNYPKGFVGADIEISELDVLGESLGRERSFGAIKGHVASGDMTFFRMSTDDRHGRIKAYVGEGEFTDDPFPMDGGIAVARVRDLQLLLKYLCRNGFEHHTAMVRSHCADIVEEAVENYMGWDLYRHR
jgi:L-fucose isomerase-like protein